MNTPRAPLFSSIFLWMGLLMCAIATPVHLLGTVSPPPVEHFFAEDEIRQMQLSPDGRYLAFLTPLGTGRVGVAIMHLATGKVEPLVSAKDDNIDQFFWKGGDRIVYSGDLGGNESAAWRAISISERKVTPLAESFRERYSDRANWAYLVDALRADPDHILIYGNKEVGSWTLGYWKLNVRTGKRISTQLSDHQETSSVANNRGAILARSRYSGDRIFFEVRADTQSRYRQVADFPANDPGWTFLSFAADDENLYLISNEENYSLHTLNVRTGELSKPLHEIEGEFGSLIMSYDRAKLYGLYYTTEKTHYHWFDDARGRLQAQIDASLPGKENFVVSTTEDEQLMIIHSSSDRDPGSYYLFDRRAPRLMAMGKVNRHLDPQKLSPMEPIQFTARDGLTIHGYLTRPAGSGDKNLPLIINPHGGPYGIRDYWGYNKEVQFLASRGYAILQINYRGSGGYGKKFLDAGKREWGGKMQDDLTDAVQWAIAQGIADPERIAIYGASYGGYAALAGIVFTPELYRCAINYVGVSDLGLITSWGHRSGGVGSEIFYREWVGDDKAYQHSRSPVNFVERIRVPSLHAYGSNDPRVDIKHWTRLESKLKSHGKVYEAIVENKEGHGFDNETSRIAFYRRMEAFLAKHMPATPDPSKQQPN